MAARIKFKALPPKEAVAFFRQKGYKVGLDYRDVWQEEHQGAFTVAKAMQLDLLRDIRAHTDEALDEGVPFEKFRQELQPRLMQRGWWGRAPMQDPKTGEVKEVQLGSPRRLKVIYDTNLRTAHSEGQWQRIQDTKADFPYLIYDANNSESPRLEHSAWDGLVLPVDDPFWPAHTPTKAWGCKCRVRQLTQRMLDRRGLSVGRSPTVPTYEYINKRTGERQMVPKGVDPAFHYPHGGRRQNLAKMFGDKIAQAPADIGAAAFASATTVATQIEREFVAWMDAALSRGTPRREWRIIGAASSDDIAFLAARGKHVATAEIAVDDRQFVGVKARRHAVAGNALSRDEWVSVPGQLMAPQAVLYDVEKENLLYVLLSSTDPRKLRLAIEPDMWIKKEKRALNAIRNAQKVLVDDLRGGIKGGRYIVVRGEIE